MTSSAQIIALDFDHAKAIKSFCDQWIGKNYYSIGEVEKLLEASTLGELSASFAAQVDGDLVAIRLSLAPKKWGDIIPRGLTPEAWPVAMDDMAYFKSLFVAEDFQARGLGRQLSTRSIEALKKMGAKGVLCHSWLESPGNSSQRYLKSLGFEEKARHERFWYPIDYECTRCAPERCVCTAAEMVLAL